MGDTPKVSLLILPSSLCYDQEIRFYRKLRIIAEEAK